MTKEENDTLVTLLKRARNHKMTEAEIRQQAIGWIVGNSPEGYRPTREDVRRNLQRA